MGDDDCKTLLGLGLSIGIGEHYNVPPPWSDLDPGALLHYQDSSSRTLLLSENLSCKQFSFAKPDYFDLDVLIHSKLRYSYVTADVESKISRESILDINQSPLASNCNEHQHKDCELQKVLINNEEEKEGQGCIKKPIRLSIEQLACMEEFYKEKNNPNTKNKQALAKQLNLSPRQVHIWFQNRRARQNIMDVKKSPPAAYYSNEQPHNDSEVQNVVVSNKEEEGPRKKLRLSGEQSVCMEQCFKDNSTLNIKQKQALAKQLNLSIRQVEVWFQNKRARRKNKQRETDSEMWKRCYKFLMEENKRLQKELSKLKTLKLRGIALSPGVPLIVCPSCQCSANSNNTTHSIPLHIPKQQLCPSKSSGATYS
ncbi:hypothetical protein KI387_009134 [Taxus chinensis]|uniref:Homeobox domain-containing protein n=1 Tax=Taxus chinensis TaxID=29808 RepID=A0AA38CQX1_TAXCH|nr:hypothetical protein KI387_009134 [Taxus chinensis]